MVRGSLVEGLTQGDVYRLDVFEGEQYVRSEVEVEVLGGEVGLLEAAPEGAGAEGKQGKEEKEGKGAKGRETVMAQTYIWSDPYEDLEDQEWDFEDFKKHKMRRWMGADGPTEEGQEDDGTVQVDEGFADVDAAVKKLREGEGKSDPTGGRGLNGAISKQLEDLQRNGGVAP